MIFPKMKNFLVGWAALALILLFSWAFFHPDFFLMHDYTHMLRIAELRRSLEGGHFPVWWTQNLGYGYGMPLFLFYGPLPFYLGTFLTYFGFSTIGATKALLFLSGVLSFSGLYFTLKRWGRTAGFIGGALLLSAPYRAVDIFLRGAVSEVLAISILPWLLHGGLAIKEGKRWAVPYLAFWSGVLILTHNLTAFIALPLFALFSSLWILIHRTAQWKKQLAQLIFGYGWGGFLALFYLVPAYGEKGNTIIESILGGYFDFRLHFLYIRQLFLERWAYGGSGYGPDDGMSFHLTWILILSAGAAGILFLKRWRSLPKHGWLIPLALSGAGLSLFFALGHSQPLWEALPLLSFVQFPWRFLGPAIVLLAFGAGLGLSLIRPVFLRWTTALVIILCVIPLVRFHKPEKFLPRTTGNFSDAPVDIRKDFSSILPDYLPAEFDQKLPLVDEAHRIVLDRAEISWETNRPHQLLATTQAPEGTTITWNIADYPGWRYYVNHEQVQPEKLADGRRQLVTSTPITSVGALFGSTPLRTATLAASGLAWFVWLSVVLWRHRD